MAEYCLKEDEIIKKKCWKIESPIWNATIYRNNVDRAGSICYIPHIRNMYTMFIHMYVGRYMQNEEDITSFVFKWDTIVDMDKCRLRALVS